MKSAARWSTGTANFGAFCPISSVYRTHLEQRYGKNFLPADTTIQDWGITYDELEPYYTQFDKMFGIAGKAGNLKGQIQEGGNPFEGPRSEEYPQAPNRIAYGPSLFRAGCEEARLQAVSAADGQQPGGLHQSGRHATRAVQLLRLLRAVRLPRRRQGEPDRDDRPERAQERPARDPPVLQRLPDQSSGGRDERLLLQTRPDRSRSSRPICIVLGAFTLENIRLMLLSKIGEPYDPQTGKGVVGRNYTYQLGAAGGTVWYDDRIVNRFMGSGANGYCIDEFNGDNFDHSGLGFFGGGNIACNNTGARPIMQSGPLPPGTATWGSNWKKAVKQYYNRSVDFGMQGESPAYRQNYASLDPTYKDAYGNPLLRLTFNWTDNERKMVRYVAEEGLAKIVTAMGGTYQTVDDTLGDYSIVPYQSTHTCGGTIMGADPGTSVVNKYCQVWDVPNLFVVGASNYPQNAGYNPTGTAGALAFHAADGIISKYLPHPGMIA